MRTLFISGTGTEVGKTLVTAATAATALDFGARTAVMKPVQTGTGSYPADLDAVDELVPGIMHLPRHLSNPYDFQLPASPHLAARREGAAVDSGKIVQSVREIREKYEPDLLLVEGAGGLLVPLTEDFLTIDLILELGATLLIVADAGLGTINHSLLSVEAARKRKIPVEGIVLNRYPVNPGEVEKDNPEIISAVSGVKTVIFHELDPVDSISIRREISANARFRDFAESLLSTTR